MNPTQPMKEKEITLPTGAFCHVRVLTGKDFLEARRISETGGKDLIFVFATLCCKIDDKPVLYEQLLDMDLRDVMAISKVINSYLIGPV